MGESRSMLDSVRAARQLPQLSLQHATVLWGHSQGGHAALWAGTLARAYAPDVDVVGVAALAPASDLDALVGEVKNTLEGQVLGAYILTAYSNIYPDVSFDHYVRPAARVLVRETAGRCLDIPEAIPSVVTAVRSYVNRRCHAGQTAPSGTPTRRQASTRRPAPRFRSSPF